MLQPEQFFMNLLPQFQNNPHNILSYFFENKASIPKIEFLNKCTNLNMFPKDQILYIYSKLDVTFSGQINKPQIEVLLNIYQNAQIPPPNNYQQNPNYSYYQGTNTMERPLASPNFYQGEPQPMNSQLMPNPNYSNYNQSGLLQTQMVNTQGFDIRNPSSKLIYVFILRIFIHK